MAASEGQEPLVLRQGDEEIPLADPVVRYGAQTLVDDAAYALMGMALTGVVMAVLLDLPPGYIAIVGGFALVGALLHWGSSSEIVLDSTARQLLLNIRFSHGYCHTHCLAAFDDCQLLAVNGLQRCNRHEVWWIYAIAVVTNTGTVIPLTSYFRGEEGFDQARANGQALATRFGWPCLEPQAERMLETEYDGARKRLTVDYVAPSLLHGLPHTVCGVLGYCALKLLLSLLFSVSEDKQWPRRGW